MTTTAGHPALRYRWLIFAVLSMAYFFVYFHRLSLSVVADTLVKAFNTDAGTIGLMGSVYFYCYALMQLPAGLLSDSVGPRRTVTFFLLVASAGSILFGFAPNIQTAFAGRVLVGFGVSMVFIPTMKILSQWYYKHEFASMAGILNAVGGMGVMAATWLLAVMTEELGWRLSFELIGGATFLIVILVWLIVRDKPEAKGWPALLETGSPDPKTSRKQDVAALLNGIQRVLSEKYFWPVAFWFFFDCGIFFGLGGLWAGPYLMHAYGLSREGTGAVLSMIAWGMIIGSPIIGYASDRLFRSRKKPFILCNTILTLELLLLWLFPASLPHWMLYGVFFIFSICASAVVVVGFTAVKELFPVEMAGTSVGTVNLFPFLGGAVFMPMLGKILDAYPRDALGVYSVEGYKMMMMVLLASSVAGLFCTFLMKETHAG